MCCSETDYVAEKPSFQNLLNRLRFGICTHEDFELLNTYIVCNRDPSLNFQKLNIKKWVEDCEQASPLICYTNVVRDAVSSYHRSGRGSGYITHQDTPFSDSAYIQAMTS